METTSLDLQTQVETLPPDQITITIKGFPSGAICNAVCKVRRVPGEDDSLTVNVRESWDSSAPAGTLEEEAWAHHAVNKSMDVFLGVEQRTVISRARVEAIHNSN